MDHSFFFKEASKIASQSLCLRDKCGAVVVLNNEIVGRGYNAPPQDNRAHCKCELDLVVSKKPKSDRTCCIHAEWRAILEAVVNKKIVGATLYFVRVNDNGDLKESDGIPYCTVCSRLALDTGVAFFGLWTQNGPKMFEIQEYNDLSYQFHKTSLI